MFEMHLISGPTDGWQTASPAKLNVKTGPIPSLKFSTIYYSFGFSRLLFFLRFSERFPVILVFCTAVQYWICYFFSTIFWVLVSGFPSAKFPLSQNSSYTTALDQSIVR